MTSRRLTRTQRWSAFALLLAIPLALTGLVTSVLGGAADRTDQIPALVVNNDEMVTTTGADGTTSQILAGRLIVTNLTGDDSPGFTWSLANDESAAKALKNGSAYAVVTIPADFSKSIASLSGSSPTQANLTMTTDDAHSYLAGSIAQALGTAMTNTLGQSITEQYLAGLFGTLSNFGSSMSTASSGARQLATGVAQLHDGLVTFSTGMSSAASGASKAASGVQSYVDGVNGFTEGVDSIAEVAHHVSAGATGLAQLLNGCSANNVSIANCQNLLSTAADVATGAGYASAGAAQLQGNIQPLRDGGQAAADGVSSLASGMKKLSAGAAESASGAGQLATGAQDLATGLTQGANQLSGAATDPDETARIVSQPVTIEKTVLNPMDSVRDLIALLILPASLWLGALALFVARKPFRAPELQSTAGNFRIVLGSTLRASLWGAGQLVLALIAALIVGVNVVAIGYAALLGLAAMLAFIAIHLLLKLIWPRSSNLISMMLLVLQIVVLPGVLPSQMLPNWMQSISGAFPLTWAMNGMAAIVAGTGYSAAVMAGLGLLAIAVLATALTTFVLSRKRLQGALGFAVAQVA